MRRVAVFALLVGFGFAAGWGVNSRTRPTPRTPDVTQVIVSRPPSDDPTGGAGGPPRVADLKVVRTRSVLPNGRVVSPEPGHAPGGAWAITLVDGAGGQTSLIAAP